LCGTVRTVGKYDHLVGSRLTGKDLFVSANFHRTLSIQLTATPV
jgi:hypothetical protein